MIHVTIPDKLSARINEFTGMFSQKPEEFVIEFLEEHLASDRAYNDMEICKKNIYIPNRKKMIFGMHL